MLPLKEVWSRKGGLLVQKSTSQFHSENEALENVGVGKSKLVMANVPSDKKGSGGVVH